MKSELHKESSELLMIFTRNPEPGKCKTRLAAKVGDQAALRIYEFLLKQTVQASRGLGVSKIVYYSDSVREQDIWDTAVYRKALQEGKDLGERMQKAFEDGFAAGFTSIIVIGSDLYDLNQSDLEKAFRELETSEYVLGPAKDGGYYLLGMRTPNPGLFRNKEWGKENVLRKTLEDLRGAKVSLLPEKNDIDIYEDIKEIPALRALL